MDFQFVVGHAGLGMAVLVFEDQLPTDFWEKLSFEQTKDILFEVSSETAVWQKAYECAVAKAASAKDWSTIWHFAKHRPQLISQIKPRMPVWTIYNDWKELLGNMPWGAECVWCLENMAKTAREFPHWECVHQASQQSNEIRGYYWEEEKKPEAAREKPEEVKGRFEKAQKLREQAFQEMVRTAKTFSDWTKVGGTAGVYGQSETCRLALERQFALSSDLPLRKLVWLYLDYPAGPQKDHLLERIRQFNASFKEWLSASEPHRQNEDFPLKTIALAKADEIGSYDDWLAYLKEYWDWSSKDELNIHAIQKLLLLARTVDQITELLQYARDGLLRDDPRKLQPIFQRIVEVAQLPEDWCTLLRLTYRRHEYEDFAQLAIPKLRGLAGAF